MMEHLLKYFHDNDHIDFLSDLSVTFKKSSMLNGTIILILNFFVNDFYLVLLNSSLETHNMEYKYSKMD